MTTADLKHIEMPVWLPVIK